MPKKLGTLIYKWDIMSAVLPLIILVVIFTFTTKGFLSGYNLQSLGRGIGVTIVVGLSQLCVLAIGDFNLALGSMGCFSAIVTTSFMEVLGVDVLTAFLAGVATGTLLGFFEGFLITKTGINPFIITLSLSSVYLGLAIGLTKAALFQNLPADFKNIGKVNILGIPEILIIGIAIAVVLYFVINKTLLGRQLLAVGANKRAAIFSGIQVNKIIISSHTLSGMLAGIAGILMAAKLGVGQDSIGLDWMMISFAAPVLGGTLLSGGKVNIVGTVFGAALMHIISNGLVMINISQYWFQTFMGLVLLGAYEIDRLRSRSLTLQRVK